MLNLIGNVFMCCGAVFIFIAALGLFHLRGLYLKMHAATKAGTLGTGLILIGVAIQVGTVHTFIEVLLLTLFVAITNPISTHLIAKANNLHNKLP